MNWIIGPRADLGLLAGGPVLAFALLLLCSWTPWGTVGLWFAWIALLNGPHLFATYTRTYLARKEWTSRRGLLIGSLGFFLLGPAVLALDAVLARAGVAGHRVPFLAYVLLATLWPYWHMVRQHHGILRLYQRRGGEDDPLDLRADVVLLHAGLLAPFLAFVARHPDARAAGARVGIAGWPSLDAACLAVLGAALAFFLWRQLRRLARGLPLNGPKLLFLLAILPYYAAVGLLPAFEAVPILGLIPLFIIPHDLQYQAMVWYYNRNRARRDPAPDLGCRVSSSWPAYLLGAGLLGLFLAAISGSVDATLGGGGAGRDLLLVTFHGFFLHHYFVDQFIWKPGVDADVARNLGVA